MKKTKLNKVIILAGIMLLTGNAVFSRDSVITSVAEANSVPKEIDLNINKEETVPSVTRSGNIQADSLTKQEKIEPVLKQNALERTMNTSPNVMDSAVDNAYTFSLKEKKESEKKNIEQNLQESDSDKVQLKTKTNEKKAAKQAKSLRRKTEKL